MLFFAPIFPSQSTVLLDKSINTMQVPLIPTNEAERIAVLREMLILDSEPEERFDALTAYCQSRFDVPIALVSLVDCARQWFKSSAGLPVKETPREISFCGHAILTNEVMVVSDAHYDARFSDNPLVVGPPFIRFYAGAPLTVSSGHNIGTLCLIGTKAKSLASEEVSHLQVLALMVARELEQTGSGGPPFF